MNTEFDKIEKTRTVMLKLAKGINPVTGEMVEKDNFLNDPKIVRSFYYASEIMDNVVKGVYGPSGSRLYEFVITPEQKAGIRLPEGNIGVNEFSRCVNACIDLSKSKRLTGVELNKKLKTLGVLGEEETAEGRKRTIVNDNSSGFGFDMEKRTYNGVEYDMVVMNDNGKSYLIENLESIMSTK